MRAWRVRPPAWPRWAWVLVGVLAGLVVLPVYLVYFGWVTGLPCPRAAVVDFLMPWRG